MPFAALPATPPSAFVREESGWSWQRDILWSWDLLYCDPTQQLVDSFRVGETFYRMLCPLPGVFEPPIMGKSGRFIVSGLEPHFIGKGGSLDEAQEDWKLSIDLAVQQLLATQDFERSGQERSQWGLLSRYFDLNEIRYSRPLKIRDYGRLVSNHSRRFRVRWIDGSTDKFTRAQIPDVLVGFRVGQPFEAVVRRNPRTWVRIAVDAVFATSELPLVSEQEAKELLGDVSSAKSLPKLSWD